MTMHHPLSDERIALVEKWARGVMTGWETASGRDIMLAETVLALFEEWTARGAKRPNGTGTVYQRKDGRWVAAVAGKADGQRVRKQVYAPTKEAAAAALSALEPPQESKPDGLPDRLSHVRGLAATSRRCQHCNGTIMRDEDEDYTVIFKCLACGRTAA